MQSFEVPREQWDHFLTDLSQSHQGWQATIELQSPDFGAQHVADKVPLQGINFEVAGTQAGSIEIGVGEVDTFLTHLVEHPTHVRVAEAESGVDVAVEIESESGPVTLLQLHPAPEIPDQLD